MPKDILNSLQQPLRIPFAQNHKVIRIADKSGPHLFLDFLHLPYFIQDVKIDVSQKRGNDSSHTIDNFEFEQTVRYTRGWNKNNS